MSAAGIMEVRVLRRPGNLKAAIYSAKFPQYKQAGTKITGSRYFYVSMSFRHSEKQTSPMQSVARFFNVFRMAWATIIVASPL